MELFLNLVWLLMALPAYWLWRRGASSRARCQLTPLQFFFALACTLVLLFPVISATDDLHAMRAEMEDGAVSKRAVRQIAGDKASGWISRAQGTPFMAASVDWFLQLEVGIFHSYLPDVSPLSRPSILHAGRSPPFSFLG
jgi:hypothetical protein